MPIASGAVAEAVGAVGCDADGLDVPTGEAVAGLGAGWAVALGLTLRLLAFFGLLFR